MKHANKRQNLLCVVSGFRREADENFALVGYYAVNSGNFLLTFQDNLSAPSSGGQDGADRLSQNVGNKLPLFAV
jgi:hypothetical protein